MNTENSQNARIVFIKGGGRESKAKFQVGEAFVPASVITRLLNQITDKPQRVQERDFLVGLAVKYGQFLDELDRQEISLINAIRIMGSSRETRTLMKRSNTQKLAEIIAKALCRKYADKTAEDMVESFRETIKSSIFESEILKNIQGMEEKFGRNEQKKIRVRQFDNNAIDRAKTARAGRKPKAEE